MVHIIKKNNSKCCKHQYVASADMFACQDARTLTMKLHQHKDDNEGFTHHVSL